jgi:hypothetical protein
MWIHETVMNETATRVTGSSSGRVAWEHSVRRDIERQRGGHRAPPVIQLPPEVIRTHGTVQSAG